MDSLELKHENQEWGGVAPGASPAFRCPSGFPIPPAPLPWAGERQNAVSGNALQWLGSTPDVPGLQGPRPGVDWAERPGWRNRELGCVLYPAVLSRGARAHSFPRLQPQRPTAWTRRSTVSKWPAATSSWRLCLEGVSGKPTFNLEVVWLSQNFWNVLGALETYCSFYKPRHLAFKRDVFLISQHCGGLLSCMSVSEGEKYLSGQTPRVHPERSTLEVKPELNLLIV